ncbi:MAG: NAD(+)/NADH kinase [Anaerolineae bacterium]|nr:NAD(+)/NADH kinase [Anaerolineae bacterium]
MTDERAPHFHRVGLLSHPMRQESLYLARQIAQWLAEQSIEATILSQWDQGTVYDHLDDWDLIVSLGGDGTMLRAARASAIQGVPVVGINMGHLGFLTEFSPQSWQDGLAAVLRGEYWLEKRLLLEVTWWCGSRFVCRDEALNDVVISRGATARLVEFETYIDEAWTTTYRADALIIATPTGSTAYALAAGGPILPPELHNLVIVPVAPHLSLARPLVLSGDAGIEVIVHRSHQAVVTVDGQLMGELEDGDRVVVRAARHTSRFIRTGGRTYFYRSILDRMEPKQLSESGRTR